MQLNLFTVLRKFLLLGGISVLSQSALAQTPATMADYWAGNARWTLSGPPRTFNDPAWQFDSSGVRTVGNNWYLFSRINSSNASCPSGVQSGTQVRMSTDKGLNWTAAVAALTPTAGTAWACAATDGDATYDAAQNKWRFLFQCLGTDNIWRGCYAERAGADPLGAFTPVAQNPVIQPRSLWSKICNIGSDDCYVQSGGNVFDEGTFNIFRFDGTHYWISFHGFDGVRGYRGIAKTANFLTYYAGGETGGAGEATPTDAIIDKNDGVAWRESWDSSGNIGAGHGHIIADGGYYYILAEMADKNLGCTAGQNWDFGLFRSSSLSATTWAQFPQGNPVIYSSKLVEYPSGAPTTTIPCNVQYAQIFKDDPTNTFYLKYYRDGSQWSYRGTYFYRLTKSSNVLNNGDLWKATGEGWNRSPASPTNMAVYRYPHLSPDGTPVMAANCGQPTCSDQSVYQDVDVSARQGRPFTFGGQFSIDGGNGTLSLAVFQLDQSYNILQSHSVPVNVSVGAYTNASSASFVIATGAKFLRYQFYMYTAGASYLADNMYINVD